MMDEQSRFTVTSGPRYVLKYPEDSVACAQCGGKIEHTAHPIVFDNYWKVWYCSWYCCKEGS